MKILVILGSLRKGNTYSIVQKIEQIHKQAANVEYEYLFLKDINLQRCCGCFSCIANGEQTCPLKDDRDLIIQKIESADGVILACPNYVLNVPWLMKNYMDRFAYIFHRPKYFGKRFMIVISSGSYMGAKNAFKNLSYMVSGGTIISRLIVYISPGMNDKKRGKQDVRIRKAAAKFIKEIGRESALKLRFSYLPWFSAMKTSAMFNRDSYKADYEFYKDIVFFPEYKLNKFQRIILNVFQHIFNFCLRNGLI